MAIEGPAGGRPCINAPAVVPVRRKVLIRSKTCACRIDGAAKCSPAAAVPVSTNIPEPIMAPIPSAVSDHGPSVFLRRCPGSSASAISLSMDLQQSSWLLDVRAVGGCAKGFWSPVLLTSAPAIGTWHVASERGQCAHY